MSTGTTKTPAIEVTNLTMAYGEKVIQKDLSFTINQGDVFVIMGESGCGKSTLMRHLLGLKAPAEGRVVYSGSIDFWKAGPEVRNRIMRRCGVLYQHGALWSSMTLGENVALPLQEYTGLSAEQVTRIVSLKLALVGLEGYEDLYPAELSGGMQKRAGLARAMALDPEFLFFDELSAGLDPINARKLDDLVLELRKCLGTTVVLVTHELPSIFNIGTNSVFLDTRSKTIIAQGDPKELLRSSEHPRVRAFLTRGEEAPMSRRETAHVLEGRQTQGVKAE